MHVDCADHESGQRVNRTIVGESGRDVKMSPWMCDCFLM